MHPCTPGSFCQRRPRAITPEGTVWSRGGTRQCLPDQGELQLPEAAKSSGFTALRNKLDAKRKGHAGVGNAGAEAPRERLCRRLPSCSPTQDMPGDRPAALAQFSGTICYFGNTLPVPGALLTPSPRADPPALVPKCQGKGAMGGTLGITRHLQDPLPS